MEYPEIRSRGICTWTEKADLSPTEKGARALPSLAPFWGSISVIALPPPRPAFSHVYKDFSHTCFKILFQVVTRSGGFPHSFLFKIIFYHFSTMFF